MSSSDHLPAGPSLAGRFAAAIALFVGFYVLAIALAAALLAVAIVPWIVGAGHNLWVTITALVLAGTILAAIVPRRLRFHEPGLRITREQQPGLFELVASEAEAAGEPLPDEVYLTLEPNAAVTQVARHRRVLIIGVPLLHILSERELRGVLAHEFGHYAGGDTKLGAWIYRTRETIGRTIAQLDAGEEEIGLDNWHRKAAKQPFLWYGKAFLRITARISRRQEFAADRRAVDRVGRAAHVAALERIHAYAPGFDAYWHDEVVPVLQARRRPPVSEGFRRFIAHEAVAEAADHHLVELRTLETDPYDSHPSLAERVAAVEGLPEGDPDDSPCAFDLLADPDETERRLVEPILGLEPGAFAPIAWDEVGAEVYERRAVQTSREWHKLLDGVTLGMLPGAVEAIPRTAGWVDDPEIDDREGFVAAVLIDGALAALAEAGWTIEAEVAAPLRARRGDDVLAPGLALHELATGRLTAAEWQRQVSELGVADLPLGARARSETTMA